jgi:TonB family protein
MKRQILLFLITMLLAGASSASDNLEDALKQQYKKHVLGLRTPFQKGEQEFDSTGKPLKDPDGQHWRTQGSIGVEDVKLDEKTLQIKGRQIVYVPAEKKKKKNEKGPDGEFLAAGRPVKVVVHLDHPLTSADEAGKLLAGIFFFDSNHDHLLPQYLRVVPPMPERVFKVKEDELTPAKVVFAPDPDYSQEARDQRYKGRVVLSIVVDAAGEVAWVQVERAAGLGLDEQAVEAVKTWKFQPARSRSGEAVAVKLNVEISFDLY